MGKENKLSGEHESADEIRERIRSARDYEEVILQNADPPPKIDDGKPKRVVAYTRVSTSSNDQICMALIKALDKLPEKQRRRCKLYFLMGLGEDEIAKLEGVSHQMVSLSINAALVRLRKMLKK